MDKVGLHPWLIERRLPCIRVLEEPRVRGRNSDRQNCFGNNDILTFQHTQNHGFDFFGDSADATVAIDSNTVHAPEGVVSLVLLFADRRVGAVTEDI